MRRFWKRKVANLLAIIMLLSSLQGVQIAWGAETNAMEFKLERKTLQEGSAGLETADRQNSEDESAMASWNIGAAGYYLLQYYIEAQEGNGTVTKKISVQLDTSSTPNDKLKITSRTTGKTVDDTLNYTEKLFDNNSNTWQNGTPVSNQSEITKDLSTAASDGREKQEFNININNISVVNARNMRENLKIRVKVTNDTVYVYTNCISKGNITPFNLYYQETAIDPQAPGNKTATSEIFNGPKSFRIDPKHYYKNGNDIASLDTIDNISTTRPGSKPGILISFDEIKKIDGDAFTYVENIAGASDTNITLDIGTRYTLDSMSNAMRLDFIPKDGEGVKINRQSVPEYSSNVVEVKDHKVNIYLAKNKVEGINTPNVIEWNKLDTSTIVDASLQYGNQKEKYWPDNKGYTYLNYSIKKTSGDQVQLNIQPYNINARATYSIYILNNENTEKGSPQVVYEYDPNKTETSTITAIAPAHVPCYFQVVVNIDQNTFESQKVYYDPNQYNTSPEVTTITNIDNVYVIPNRDKETTEGNKQPQAIGFDITWEAPTGLVSLLKDGNGSLYYELLMRKDKDDYDPINNTTGATSDIYATYSKIFKVSLDAQNRVIVETVAGTAGKDNNSKPEARYNMTNNTFTMENVSLMNFGATGGNWEKLNITENHLDGVSGSYLGRVKDTQQDSLTDRPVPGVYYFSFRTVFVSNEDDKQIVYSEESNLKSLTLDTINEIVPVPEKIDLADATQGIGSRIDEKVTITDVDVRNYVNKMLEPANLYLYKDDAKTTGRYSGFYELYLYQKTYDEQQFSDKVNALSASSYKDVQDGIVSLSNDELEQLRKGEIIPIKIPVNEMRGEGTTSITIQGLDENQVYYIKTRTKLSPWRDSVSQAGKDDRYSIFSKDFTFTTTTTPVPPTPEDKVPPAPEKIWVKNPVSEDSPTLVKAPTVKLGWTPVLDEVLEDSSISKVYYEFVRLSKEMNDTDKNKTVEELVGTDSEKNAGFKSQSADGNNPYMSTYVKGSWTDLSPVQNAAAFELTDNTLETNKIYYYYVRTVAVIDGKQIKSGWIMVPVTTTPVIKPENLKVETEKYTYDPKTEIVISFDAAIPENASVPTDYDFDIAIKREDENDYTLNGYSKTMITSTKDNEGTPEGYTHFVYRIRDLKPSKRYYIKVRTVDKTGQTSEGKVTSLYTDPVSTRTDYDESEARKDEKYEEYLKKFDQEVEKLRRKPYWTVEDKTVYKYRDSYINADIAGQKEYQLITEDDKEVYYYFPAGVLKKASEDNVTLNIKLGDYTASIRPNTLTEDTQEIADAIDKMDANKLQDYYIGVRFRLSNTSEKINNEEAITPKMEIDAEVIQLKDEDFRIESDIQLELENIIKDEREDFIKHLEGKVEANKISDETLQGIIDDSISDIEKAHRKKVDRIISKAKKNTYSIDKLDKPVLLMAKTDSFAVNVYYYSRGWIQTSGNSTGDVVYIEATQLGTYIITGQQALIDKVPSLAPYQSFIAKYGLTDFFTLENGMTKVAVTKQQLYGAVARIMGAERNVDYIVFLQNNGIKGVNKIGTAQAVRQDQAIYVIMQGYEKTHNRKVNSVRIQNRQCVTNIGAFQPVYRDYVYAAVELKIVDNPNSQVLPSKQMTVEEIITMLYKMQY